MGTYRDLTAYIWQGGLPRTSVVMARNMGLIPTFYCLLRLLIVVRIGGEHFTFALANSPFHASSIQIHEIPYFLSRVKSFQETSFRSPNDIPKHWPWRSNSTLLFGGNSFDSVQKKNSFATQRHLPRSAEPHVDGKQPRLLKHLWKIRVAM